MVCDGDWRKNNLFLLMSRLSETCRLPVGVIGGWRQRQDRRRRGFLKRSYRGHVLNILPYYMTVAVVAHKGDIAIAEPLERSYSVTQAQFLPISL